MLLNCGVGKDSWESLRQQGGPTSPSFRKSVLNVHWRDWCWGWNSNTLAIGKDPDAGKDWGQEEKGATEDKMVGWHHRLNRHEFVQTLGDCEGQGSLVSCSPWGHKEPDTTERLNNNKNNKTCNITSWPNGGRCIKRGLRSLEMRYRGFLLRIKVTSQPSLPGTEGFQGCETFTAKTWKSPWQIRMNITLFDSYISISLVANTHMD